MLAISLTHIHTDNPSCHVYRGCNNLGRPWRHACVEVGHQHNLTTSWHVGRYSCSIFVHYSYDIPFCVYLLITGVFLTHALPTHPNTQGETKAKLEYNQNRGWSIHDKHGTDCSAFVTHQNFKRFLSYRTPRPFSHTLYHGLYNLILSPSFPLNTIFWEHGHYSLILPSLQQQHTYNNRVPVTTLLNTQHLQ